MTELEREIVETFYRLEELERRRARLERLWGKTAAERVKPGPTKAIQLQVLTEMGEGEVELAMVLKDREAAKGHLEDLAQQHPLWDNDLRLIKGFGANLAGKLIAASGDITRVTTVSGFWKSFGLDVLPDGTAPRKVRGRKKVERRLPAMPLVLKVSFLLTRQLMMARGKAYGLYLKERAWYEENRPDWPAWRQHKAARRAMEKIFLSCLLERWCQLSGLPFKEPYIWGILKKDPDGHTRYTLDDFKDRPEGKGARRHRV